jgi:hypothetical protein
MRTRLRGILHAAELLNDLARYRAKARGTLSFYAKSICAAAHSAKAVADFTRSRPCFRG